MRNSLSIFKKENWCENSENDYFKNRDNAMWDTKVLVHTEFMLWCFAFVRNKINSLNAVHQNQHLFCYKLFDFTITLWNEIYHKKYSCISLVLSWCNTSNRRKKTNLFTSYLFQVWSFDEVVIFVWYLLGDLEGNLFADNDISLLRASLSAGKLVSWSASAFEGTGNGLRPTISLSLFYGQRNIPNNFPDQTRNEE